MDRVPDKYKRRRSSGPRQQNTPRSVASDRSKKRPNDDHALVEHTRAISPRKHSERVPERPHSQRPRPNKADASNRSAKRPDGPRRENGYKRTRSGAPAAIKAEASPKANARAKAHKRPDAISDRHPRAASASRSSRSVPERADARRAKQRPANSHSANLSAKSPHRSNPGPSNGHKRHRKQPAGKDLIQKNMLPGTFASSLDGNTSWLATGLNKYILLAVIAVVAVLLIWHPWANTTDSQVEPESSAPQATIVPTLEQALAAQPAYASLSPNDFSNIKATDKETTFGFTLSEGEAPTLSAQNEAALNEVLAYYNDNDISVGYILMDIGSGRGFARNIDEKIYGASSFKGPFCTYLLMNKVETDEYKLTSSLRDGVMSNSGHFSFKGKDTLKNMISDTIIYSDNGSFGALRSGFSDSNLSSWLSSIGADSKMAYDEWFPHYTARDAARLWSATYNYIGTGTDGAQLLDTLYGSTETSFMRDALTDDGSSENEDDPEQAGEASTADGEEQASAVESDGVEENGQELVESAEEPKEGEISISEAVVAPGSMTKILVEASDNIKQEMIDPVIVRSKAGWYPGSSKSVSSISENGIVTLNGRDYLLCVMTNSYFNDKNTAHMHDLINAVFNLRNDLVSLDPIPAPNEEEVTT